MPVLTRPDYSFMQPAAKPATATPATGISSPVLTPPAPATPSTATVKTRPPLYSDGSTTATYNPYTKGAETVNPTVGVNYGAYSPENKQALWQQSGQTGAANMEAFFRGTDGTLQIKPEFVRSVDPSTLATPNEANAYLKAYETDR